MRLNPKYIEVKIPATTLVQTFNIKTIASKALALKSAGASTTVSQFVMEQVIPALGDLGVDAIKLDTGFMAYTQHNDWSLKALIEIAHDLKLKIIGGGVQSKAQMQFLRKQCCDQV